MHFSSWFESKDAFFLSVTINSNKAHMCINAWSFCIRKLVFSVFISVELCIEALD